MAEQANEREIVDRAKALLPEYEELGSYGGRSDEMQKRVEQIEIALAYDAPTLVALAEEALASRATIATLRAVADRARAVNDEARATGRWTRPLRSLSYALDTIGDWPVEYMAMPRWIFKPKQYAGGPAHFLLTLHPEGGFPSIDGAHSDPAGVAQARAIISGIRFIAPGEGARHLMLTVQQAPQPGGDVNQGATDTLNRIGPR